MKRRLLAIAVMLLLFVAFGLFWLRPPVDPINAENFARIESGMTEREVEQILGGPGTEASNTRKSNVLKRWDGRRQRAIWVGIDMGGEENLVSTYKEFHEPDLSFWDRVKTWWEDRRSIWVAN
jgi:hypothetical protein